LIRVDEPVPITGLGDIASPNQKIDYTYDALNNLIRVQQGSQQNRYFLYDSLKRLTRAFNPEQDANTNLPALTDPLTQNTQWNSLYTYDNNSNLATKVEARNITTTYTYDELNRVKIRSYSAHPANTPAVTYTYDATSVAFSFSTHSFVDRRFTRTLANHRAPAARLR
jgi:YD repeat-containing protein